MKSTFDPSSGVRIAYLVSQYPAVNHTFILREIRALRRLGAQIHVASVSEPDRAFEEMTSDEIEEARSTFYVKAVGVMTALGRHLSTFFSRPGRYLAGLFLAMRIGQFQPQKTLAALLYFAEAVVVGRWMQSNKLSHVHIHFSSTVGLIMDRIFPLSFSVTIHGPAEFDDPVGFRLREKITTATFVCAISNYSRSQLMKVSEPSQWDKIEVSPLGIDPGIFVPRPSRPAPKTFELITVGRLTAVKAQHVLLDAVHLLHQGHRAVRLRLVGDGPDRESLERSVSANGLTDFVDFAGWRNQGEVIKLYEQADIFVLPSFAEGVPVVLMEAMAMEIPCVATRITGIPELIRDEVDGILVSPSSAEEIAEAVIRLMDDDELRRRLGKSGRVRVIEKYDLEKNTRTLLNVMQSHLHGKVTRKDLNRIRSG